VETEEKCFSRSRKSLVKVFDLVFDWIRRLMENCGWKLFVVIRIQLQIHFLNASKQICDAGVEARQQLILIGIDCIIRRWSLSVSTAEEETIIAWHYSSYVAWLPVAVHIR